MEQRELEQLADLVLGNLSGRVVPEESRRSPNRTIYPTRGEPGSVGRWEVPDAGWRMPVMGREWRVGSGGVELAGTRGSAALARLPESGARPSRDTPLVGPVKVGESSAVRIADYVDHTLLKAEATRQQIEHLCQEAAEHRFAAVCVNGAWVPVCRKLLAGSGVKVAAVVGFPLGATTSTAKAAEARHLVELGADELDMVAAVGHILDGEWDYVEDDIRTVVESSKARTVKVILETATLEPLQIVKASAIAKEAGAHFVKTSTGFHPAGGATAQAVALMRLAVGDELGVKAAGGVRDCATALRMIAAGASRIGTSSGVSFVECMGTGPLPITELLGAPERHEAVCKTGSCGMVY